MIRLLGLDPEDAQWAIFRVYRELREWNLREITAAFPQSPHPIVEALEFHLTTPAIRKFVFLDNKPIALAGCIPLVNGEGRLYFIGTPEVEEYGVRIAALIRRFLPEAMESYGIPRLECRALQGNDKTPRWFEALGGVFTRSEQDQFGTNFDIYEWSSSDVHGGWRRRRGRTGSGATASGGTGEAEPDPLRHVPDRPDL